MEHGAHEGGLRIHGRGGEGAGKRSHGGRLRGGTLTRVQQGQAPH
jgi:hypothetical protein